MVVPDDDDLRSGVVERLKHTCGLGAAAVIRARAETRMVPVGDRAPLRARGEVRSQPRFLSRSRAHADVRVERDNVPVTEIVAVVSHARLPREGPKIAVVPAGPGRVVVVIPGGGAGPCLVTAPRGVVTLRVVRVRAIGVGVVAGGKDGPRNVVQ